MAHKKGTKLWAIDSVSYEDRDGARRVDIPMGGIIEVVSDEVTLAEDADTAQLVEYQLVSYESQIIEVPMHEFLAQSS